MLMEQMPLLLPIPFFFIVLSGSSNAINLTDGIDGLAIGCTITVAYPASLRFAAAIRSFLSICLSVISWNRGITGQCGYIGCKFLFCGIIHTLLCLWVYGVTCFGGIIGVIAFMIHQPFTWSLW